nr:phospholipase D-like domain-containing protein [Azospirillum sp. TSO5]
MALHQAINSAKSSIVIMTPYFLPDERLSAALEFAAWRGVNVNIIVPEASDHALVDWAVHAHVAPLLAAGCHIWKHPPPFEHSKIVLVDYLWTFLGSANWDRRSLRINSEMNMEVYDRELAQSLKRDRLGKPLRHLTAADINARSTARKSAMRPHVCFFHTFKANSFALLRTVRCASQGTAR